MSRRRSLRHGAVTALASVAVAVSLVGCGAPSKPDDPVEFVTTWLDAVVNSADDTAKCEATMDWMSDAGKDFHKFATCGDVFARVELPADTDVDELGCVLTGNEPQPGQEEVSCPQAADLFVLFSGEGDTRMIERIKR